MLFLLKELIEVGSVINNFERVLQLNYCTAQQREKVNCHWQEMVYCTGSNSPKQ